MSRTPTLSTLGEFEFLAQLLPTLRQRPDVLVGPGDDCAVVRAGRRPIVLTTDAVVEGVHFERAWMTPQQLGRRSVLVNLSDLAAMGATPTFCLVSIGAPAQYPAADLRALHAGIEAVARGAGMAVVGGNLTRAQQLFISLTALGQARHGVVRRAGARSGHSLYVTGTLGDAALGVAELRRGHARGTAVRRYREPQPRLTAGALLAEHRIASAMIDVSDGLLQDLGHLAAASGVGAVVDVDALPYSPALRRVAAADALERATRGGDDYELLFTVPPRRVAALERLHPRLGCPITRIGHCVPKAAGIDLHGAGDVRLRGAPVGWDHFRRT